MGEGQIWVETDSLVDEEGGVAEMRGDRFVSGDIKKETAIR